MKPLKGALLTAAVLSPLFLVPFGYAVLSCKGDCNPIALFRKGVETEREQRVSRSRSKEFGLITTQQRAICVRALKNQLRDPSSLVRTTPPSMENLTGVISYKARNGFGGYASGEFNCLPVLGLAS